MCGRIDEGSAALRNVLAEVGMRAPRTTFGALFWLIVYRIGLSLLGLRYRQRAPEDVSPKDRLQLDALFAFQIGMNHVDFILGSSMGVRFTLLALRKGDALHVLHGLVLEFGRAAATGESDRTPKAVAAMAQTVQLASAAGPQGETFWQRELGIAHYLRGRFASAIAAFDMARSTHRTPADLGARLHAVWALFFTGRLRDEGIQARRLLRASEDRGDLVTSVSLRVSSMADMSLVADDPNGARRSLVEAMALWTQHGFHLQHWLALFWEARIDHYVGAPEKAWQRLERHEAPLKRSLLLEILSVRVISGYMGGCCAVGAAAIGREGKRRRALLAEARRRARRLDRELEDATAPTYAAILDASVAYIEGRHGIAKARLENAVRLAEAADLKLHAAAARYQLGRLLGGDSGRALLAEGERWMRSEGIRAPERWAEVLVPGRWNSAANCAIPP
jgi:tetratricopeptide (TPR) repeat protein